MNLSLTLTASSTALFSTWVFVEELGLLFDAGDGVAATLLQKSRKIGNVFISHADRDHVCGLLQLHQLNAADGKPRIFYPRDSGSFPALREFVGRFDPQSGPASWEAQEPGDVIDLGNGYSVLAHASAHIEVEGQVKALSFTLRQSRRSLKAEFRGRPGKEIAELRAAHGEAFITEERVDNLIGYSGDSPRLETHLWADHRVLLHECTFLEADTAKRPHANLPALLADAAELPLEALVLMHFSARYSEADIRAAITRIADEVRPGFPIFAVFPGQVSRDLLRQVPVWSGNRG